MASIEERLTKIISDHLGVALEHVTQEADLQDDLNGRSQGWRLTPSEVAQALRSAAASGSYIAEPILRPAN